MRIWLTAAKNGENSIPWIINLTHSGLKTPEIEAIKPFMKSLIVGKDFRAPDALWGMNRVFYDPLRTKGKKLSKKDLTFLNSEAFLKQKAVGSFEFEKMRGGRDLEVFWVKTEEPVTPIVFKRAFYRGWRAEINYKKTTIYRVSPGLQLILVPRGEHFITWRYTGSNNWLWAWISFLLGFVMTGILLGFYGKRRRNVSSEPMNKQLQGAPHMGVKRYAKYLVPLICAVFVFIVLLQVVSEAYYKKPVIIRPRDNHIFETEDGNFDWNPVVGIPKKKQSFLLQIASDSGFEDIIIAKKVKDTHVRLERAFKKSGPYYFRVRMESDGKGFQWSGPIKFYGAGRF
jgi:hypothetical protein